MKKISDETNQIFKLIETFGPVRSSELIKKTGLSSKNIYKHLAKLLQAKLVEKIGAAPRIYYGITKSESSEVKTINTFEVEDLILEHNYIYVSPSGIIIRGFRGFTEWCSKNHFDFDAEKIALITKLKEVNKLKKNNIISAKKIILSGRKELYLDDIFFSDFYTLDHFGKTKLGQLVYVGKSSQNKELIQEIAELVKTSINYLIEKYSIQYLCFIPPTIDRRLQFLDEFKQALGIDLPEIKIAKISGPTKIAQKTLRKLEDRIINASSTISVNLAQQIQGNVLVIDDATGSGATINETAKKIRLVADNGIKIIGYTVVGSYKGFDVISEV